MIEFEGKLPLTWITTSLGEVCSQPQYGYTTKGSDTGTLRLLRTTDITSGDINWDSVPFCLENPDDENKYLLKDGDIVISRAGSVGVSYLLKKPERSVFASYLIRFKPYIDVHYFKYFLGSPYYWKEIADNKLGIAVPNVNASKLSEIAIPLPPECEQRRIVAKIEELFSELDKGIENLKAAQAQLKVYRQALLKHAFEGKLTAQWRADNPDKLEPADALLKRIQQERAQRYKQQLAEWEAGGKQGSKPKAPKALAPLTTEELAELPELPDGWGWEKNENYLFEVKDGTHATPKYVDTGIPFVTQKNIKNGKLTLDDVSYISRNDHEDYFRRSNVQKGDLIISMIGHGRGQCCLVDVDTEFSIKNVGLFKFFHVLQSARFLKYYYQSSGGLGLALRESKGGAQPFIGLTELRNWPVPICSYEEQLQIVNEIEGRLSIADQLEQTLTTSLQQSEALRQSILKKAFSGQLVPQDPHDEPASVLLARIRTECANAAQKSALAGRRSRKASTK